MSESWGPSEQELHEASAYEVLESVDMGDQASHSNKPTADEDEEGDFDYGYHDSDSDAEGDLLDVAEAVAITDAYHSQDGSDLLFDFSSLTDYEAQTVMLPTDSPSPKKRKQM